MEPWRLDRDCLWALSCCAPADRLWKDSCIGREVDKMISGVPLDTYFWKGNRAIILI